MFTKRIVVEGSGINGHDRDWGYARSDRAADTSLVALGEYEPTPFPNEGMLYSSEFRNT